MTSDLLRLATDIIKRASDVLVDARPTKVEWKDDRDPATDVDLRIEHQVRELLAEATPEFGFLGEETGGTGPSDKTWVLDPLDGTVNFMHGLPMAGISLALMVDDAPQLGVIALPYFEEFYAAEAGQGATLNGRHIRTSGTVEPSSAVVAVGDYATGLGAADKNRDRLVVTATLAQHVQRIRMLGSAAADLAWVAQGRLDACVMLANHAWDVAAGTLIASEAGAVLSTVAGNPYSKTSGSLLCGGSTLCRSLSQVLSDTLNQATM